MARIYVKTANPRPTPTQMAAHKLRRVRAEKTAEYERERARHSGRRAKVARELVEITTAFLATELKTTSPADRPALPVADLFSH
ncbi:phage terminase large subunit-like protein [Angulomicrobium tetraedrale]|uniref:Phage terminase large subunit-like protein n=1 Tax=Ancylobacter tetraedralis TaxID=217068 RepID=A0A839Z9S5_9HYPH|nr:hypothetical protein [Ancylobacter tetraedralis]MBB3771477.1 phage terminase large subunit-like protein [Ancylobacter tetraedralis]